MATTLVSYSGSSSEEEAEEIAPSESLQSEKKRKHDEASLSTADGTSPTKGSIDSNTEVDDSPKVVKR
jgi:hypothetical protein